MKRNLARLKKRFDEILSEGQGRQLVFLLLLIFIAIILFWAVSFFFFRDDSIHWQDLLALFLDPGSFGGAGDHDFFRLLVSLCGLFLFSALLISVVSNIFENISDSSRKGRIRYDQKDHVLIIGGGNHLFSMLSALLESDSPYGDSEIVVLTHRNVELLKEQIFSLPFLDQEKAKVLRHRLTVYAGERDNYNDLSQKGLAKLAKVIYVIGEDDEADSDSVSFRCCEKLREICGTEGAPLRCFLLLKDSSSIKVFKYQGKPDSAMRLKIDMVDANEYLAERVLIPENDAYPPVDYAISRDEVGRRVLTPGIAPGSEARVHLVIVGMTDIARAMALTAAHICHFPSYREKGIRTVISFIGKDISLSMDRLLAEYANLFRLSHYRCVSLNEAGEALVRAFAPDPAYGDFLDVEWEFYDADICHPHMRKRIAEWAVDDRESLSFAICLPQQKDNTFAALNLPQVVYENGYPIFVYQQADDKILQVARETKHFGNIHTFGSVLDINSDPLFLKRSLEGERVNYSYSGKHADSTPLDEWFTLKTTHKLSSIYSANGMVILNHNFHLLDRDLSALTDEEWVPICDEEHRRWNMSQFLMGFSAVDIASRTRWAALAAEDWGKADKEKSDLKKAFLHYNLADFDELPVQDQKRDRDIIQEIRYILFG